MSKLPLEMPDEPDKTRHFRQSNITSFFSRISDNASSSAPPPKRFNPPAAVSVSPNLTDPWESLEEKYAASKTSDTSAVNGHVGLHVQEISDIASKSTPNRPSQSSRDASVVASTSANDHGMDASMDSLLADEVDMDAEEDSDEEAAVSPDFIPIYPDFSGTPLDQMVRTLTSDSFLLPELRSTPSHTVLVALPLSSASVPAPSGAQFVDTWDFEHLRMPCSSRLKQPKSPLFPQQGTITRWEIIRNAIIRQFNSVSDFSAALSEYHPGGMSTARLSTLSVLLEHDLTPPEAQFFLGNLMPYVANLVIELPFACPQPIPLLKKGMNHTITLSQHQVAHLIAAMFFCTFHSSNGHEKSSQLDPFPGNCFDSLFCSPGSKMAKRSQCMREKLKCMMTYFHKVKQERATGLVSFTRRCLESFPIWEESACILSRVHITHKQKIEDIPGCLQVDFANRFVGGGVLHRGCVQEEIRFVASTELLVSCLFTEMLESNECLIVTGVERFNDYSGYSDSFKWTGPHSDAMPRDSWGRRMTQVVAIDATKFGRPDEQFKADWILRELNKAYVGFSRSLGEEHLGPLNAVATGNWGCGAYRGNKQLKFLIQLLACSQAGRDMVYVTFDDGKLQEELICMYEHLVGLNVTVGDVYKILCMYYADIIAPKSNKGKNRTAPKPLFNFVYDCFSGS